MKLYLVRHGETEGNLVHLYQGDSDPLSAKGRAQGAILAKRFESIPLDLILASRYVRAMETAKMVADAKKMPVQVEDLMVERRWPKEIEGKEAADPGIQDLRTMLKEKELSDPEWRLSNEERYIDVRERAIQFLAKAQTLSKTHNDILVVSHAHMLKVLLSVIIHGPEVSAKLFRDIFYVISLHNTGITVVEYDGKQWHIVTFNDHAHLGEYHRQPH